MRYISYDSEFTDVDTVHGDGQLLMISMILEDTDQILPRGMLPQFHAIIKPRIIKGDAFAIKVNVENGVIPIIAGDKQCPTGVFIYEPWDHDKCRNDMNEWFHKEWYSKTSDKVLFAGKNLWKADLPYLFRFLQIRPDNLSSHRYLDIGTKFTDFTKDKQPPSLMECVCRANVDISELNPHWGPDDAWINILLLRHFYGSNSTSMETC